MKNNKNEEEIPLLKKNPIKKEKEEVDNTEVDRLSTLPRAVLIGNLFPYLEGNTLGTVAKVNKRLNTLVYHDFHKIKVDEIIKEIDEKTETTFVFNIKKTIPFKEYAKLKKLDRNIQEMDLIIEKNDYTNINPNQDPIGDCNQNLKFFSVLYSIMAPSAGIGLLFCNPVTKAIGVGLCVSACVCGGCIGVRVYKHNVDEKKKKELEEGRVKVLRMNYN